MMAEAPRSRRNALWITLTALVGAFILAVLDKPVVACALVAIPVMMTARAFIPERATRR